MKSLFAAIAVSMLIASTSQAAYFQIPAPPKPQTAPTPSTATSSAKITTVKELAELANSLEIKATIRERINPPTFLINADSLVFYEGSIPQLGDNVITAQNFPILIPLARKLQVDDLRQLVLIEHPEAATIQWQNAFKLADALIQQKMLAVIASGTLSDDALIQKLNEYNSGISKLFETTAREFAASRNLKFQRPGLIAPATHTVPVKFVLNPKEGKLELIPRTLFIVKGDQAEQWWRPMVEESPRLGGDYFFRVTWPNGVTSPPKLLQIQNAGQVFTINQ